MAIEARRGRADALLAFPERADPVGYHARLSRELPVIAFWLYEAAGGVAYDDATLHAILDLPGVIGIKVATLDSVMTFQRLAALLRAHPDKLLITGEDRFLGYSLMLGARGGAGRAWAPRCPISRPGCSARTPTGTGPASTPAPTLCDRLAEATFIPPMEGYVRRMLWAAAADGALPAEACDDPWGPALPSRGARRGRARGARCARGSRLTSSGSAARCRATRPRTSARRTAST